MSVDQAFKFEQKMVEFIMRRKNIKAMDMAVDEKLQQMTNLSKQDTVEMFNMLTRSQLRS